MQKINPPTELTTVGLFSAPADREIRPAMVYAKSECIEIITGGSVYFEVDGEDQIFERGSIFWHVVGEHTVYRSVPGSPYRCLAIRFDVAEDLRIVPRITFWTEGDAALDALVDEAVQAFHNETVDRMYLCEYLHRRILWAAYSYTRNSRQNLYPKPLKRALAICKSARNFTMGIRELAQAAGVSEPYLHTLFLRHLNTSPHQYLLNYRLRIARTRLAGSDDNIKTIAEECGFEHIESFYRAFRKQSGIAPGEYRRLQQPGQ